MRQVGFALLVAATTTISSAFAANYPQPYESTYETTIAGYGTQQLRYMSDGKGHVRTETTDPKGQVTLALMDYPQHTMTTTMDINGQKRFMKTPLSDYEGADSYIQDAKDLGTKVIDGHTCHGYEKTFKNGLTLRFTDTLNGLS